MYPCRARKGCKAILKKEENKYRCPKCNSTFSVKWIERNRFSRRKK
jgi:ribosomal protein L37AE/L43A